MTHLFVDLSIFKSVRRFLPVFYLCLGLLLLVPPTAPAQGLFGGATGGLTAPLRSYLGGGCNSSWFSLGDFSVGYNYHSYNFAGGVRFSELRLRYYLPLRINYWNSLNAFAIADITDLKDTPPLGLADTLLRFGGSWHTKVCGGTYVAALGEYDATRRQGKWYSGGQAAIEMFQFVSGRNVASAKATYYAESSGNSLIFLKNPSGYELKLGYLHELFYYGPRLMLTVSAYDVDTGVKQRGWDLGGSVLCAGGLFTVRGTAGHDNVILDNYSVGADVNISF